MSNLEAGCDRKGGAFYVTDAGRCRLFIQFSEGQKEDGSLQGAHIPFAISWSVVEFGGSDEGLDICAQQVFVGVVEPSANGTAGVGIHVGTVPLTIVITIFPHHQLPALTIQCGLVVVLGEVDKRR